MAQLFANNAFSTLAAGISAGGASITLATGTGSRFPALSGSDVFDITLTQAGDETSWEVVRCTARTGDVLTVTRGVEGTAAAWLTGDKVECRITAAWLNAATPLSGFRNVIINGNFQVNQRGYVSGAAVGTKLYAHDRWKMAASADTYTYSTVNNKTTVTIPAGKVLCQVVEGLNLQTGTYTLSWEGTAQGKIGAGAYGASGITGTAVGGTNLTIEFGPGTVSRVQLEAGSLATPFENRPIGTELYLCQRYFQTYISQTIDFHIGSLGTATYTPFCTRPLLAEMRTVPTLTPTNFTIVAGPSTAILLLGAAGNNAIDAFVIRGADSWLSGSNTFTYRFTASAEL